MNYEHYLRKNRYAIYERHLSSSVRLHLELFCCKMSPHCIKLENFLSLVSHFSSADLNENFIIFNHIWEWAKGKMCRDNIISTKRWQSCRKKINSFELRFELCNDFIWSDEFVSTWCFFNKGLRFDSAASPSSLTSLQSLFTLMKHMGKVNLIFWR